MSPEQNATEVKLGAGAQAVRIAFWFVCLMVLLSACGWASENVIRIPAGSRAALLRFGAFNRVQDGGLLIAWPPPFEQVILFPGPTRVLEAGIDGLERDSRARRVDAAGSARVAGDPVADPALLSDALAGS